MKTRRPMYARELVGQCARSSLLAASILTLCLSAAAQPEAAPAPVPEAAPAEPAAPEGETPSEAPEDASAPAAEEQPAAPPPAPTAPDEPGPDTGVEAAGAGTAEVGATARTDAGVEGTSETGATSDTSGVGPKPKSVEFEWLPPEAYPSQPQPGLPGGSLGFVINRLQWPYMPKYEGSPAFRVGLSGSGWLDINFREIRAGLETEDDQTEFRQQGRFTFRVTPVYNHSDDWFVQSNVEFIANADQDHTVTNYGDIDDAWIRLGKWKQFDIQVGRMQGFEVYHFGMGLDLNTFERQGAVSFSKAPAQPYGLTELWDRGVSTGGVAFHWYGPEWLKLELLARYGLSGQGNDIGIRPVGIVDLGWMKLKGGYERRLRPSLFNNSDARVETQGVGGSLQFVLAPWVEFGGGAGQRVEDAFEQDGAVRPAASHTTVTYGGFANARPYFEDWLVGIGYHRTDFEDFNFDAFGEPQNSTHHQMFGAVQYILWDQLYIKYVLAYSKGHIEERNDSDPDDDGFENESLSHRLRFMMLY